MSVCWLSLRFICLVVGPFSPRFVGDERMVLWTNGMSAKDQFVLSDDLSLKATALRVISLIVLGISAKRNRDFLILVLVKPM